MSPRTLAAGQKRDRRGRPRGRTAKQREVQAMIAAGVEPLEAFARAGFAYPAREVKRQATVVAESSGLEPREICRHVARYGEPSDKVTACGVLLRHPGTQNDVCTGRVILVPCDVDREAFVASELARIARESVESHADDDRTFARGILNSLLADAKVTDAVAVRAARALLEQHPASLEPKAASDAVTHIVGDNGRASSPPLGWDPSTARETQARHRTEHDIKLEHENDLDIDDEPYRWRYDDESMDD